MTKQSAWDCFALARKDINTFRLYTPGFASLNSQCLSPLTIKPFNVTLIHILKIGLNLVQ